MSQAGYTPIQLYFSTTAAAVPVNTNLANGELAINITDGKLYYKDNGGTVRLLASNATSAPVLSFQTSLSGLTPSTATTGVVTLAGTLGVASGGTGLTTLATGSLSYGAGTSAFSALAIGTAGQILTVNSGATAPQWSTLSGVAVTTFSAGTTGFTPSSATAGAVTLAGTLATTNGGTGLTSFTSGGVVYASSTSALATGSGLTFGATGNLGVGTSGETMRLALRGDVSNSTFPIVKGRIDAPFAGGWNTLAPGTTVGGYQLFTYRTDTFDQNKSSAIEVYLVDNLYGAGRTAMRFLTGGYNNVDGTEKMRLNEDGNLGIGTSSPNNKLEVYGSAGLFRTNATTTGSNYWEFYNAGSRHALIGTADGSTNNFYVSNEASADILFRTFATERVRITSNGTLTLKNDYKEQTYTANSSTAITLDIVTNGTDQVITLTGTATITMPTATAGKSFLLKLKTGAGGYTVTWSTVKWPSGTAPTLTSTASRMDIFSFFSDGTNWYGCTVGQNYTP